MTYSTSNADAVPTVQFIGLIGRPGSGKGTLALKLEQTLPQSQVISFGDLIRDSVLLHHPFHEALRQARDESDAGRLPAHELVWPTFRELIRETFVEGGFRTLISDGVPRTAEQVGALQHLFAELENLGIQVRERYLYLFAPEILTEKRIEHRRLEALGVRRIDDDSSRSLIRREYFEDRTWTAVRALDSADKLSVVDARRSPDEVFAQVVRELASERPRPLEDAFQELRGWSDDELEIDPREETEEEILSNIQKEGRMRIV